ELAKDLDLLLHLPLADAGELLRKLVARLPGDEDDDAPRALPPGAAAALDGADLAGDGLVEDHEVHLRDVEPLLGDAGGDEDVVLAGLEALDHLALRLLGHAAVALAAARLPHEARGAHALHVLERRHEGLAGVAVVGEDDDARVGLLLQLLAQEDGHLPQLGVLGAALCEKTLDLV